MRSLRTSSSTVRSSVTVSLSRRTRSLGTARFSTTGSSAWSVTSCSSSEIAGPSIAPSRVGVRDRLALDAQLLALDRDGLLHVLGHDVLAQAGAARLALRRADAQLLLGARHRVVGLGARRVVADRRRASRRRVAVPPGRDRGRGRSGRRGR